VTCFRKDWLTILAGLVLVLLGSPLAAQQSQIAGTVHNLSISGPGTVRAVSEDEICIFCHTPHHAQAVAPLWNRLNTTTSFTLYPSGGSMQSTPGQPNGSSRLCLSCHDGTAAVGLVQNPNQTFQMVGVAGSGALLGASNSNLGTSLADDHPVSLTPSLADPEIALPISEDDVQLDGAGQVQCRSCHDPHDNTLGNFLVKTTENGELCTTCHPKGSWSSSFHGSPLEPTYSQLITQGCGSCHDDHSAPVPARLLVLAEETLCFACHDGTQDNSWEVSGATDLTATFQKTSIHPITVNPGVHDPGEGPIGSSPTPSSYLPEEDPGALRHVECVDCHNPHSVNPNDVVGGMDGAMDNTWGIAENGTKIYPATREYQVCFKCHSDSENLPADESNKRLEFVTTNASYHPVIAPGTNPNQGSLLSPWTPSSTMDCTDCHGNDDGSGPQGPHGSQYSPLLKANYNTAWGVSEDATQYALCYQCHDQMKIYQRISFRFHGRHVQSGQMPCISCHDVHGTPGETHLQSWTDSDDPLILPADSGPLQYIDNGDQSGTCYVNCHGRNHDPKNY
jgi:predicted CXXCH cytochrome family protein